MPQLVSKEVLEEKAQKYFDSHPDAKKFYATQDGQFFLNKSFAIDHNSKVVKGKVVTIERIYLENQKAKSKGADKDDEMDALRAEYFELTESHPAPNIKKDTLIKKIEELKFTK